MSAAAPRLAIIAAVAENRVIGVAGEMPWKLSADLRRFKQLTLGKPVIMGRRTWLALGKPLYGRLNIVITRDRSFVAEGGVVVRSLDEGIAVAKDWARAHHADEAMVIGGGEVYAQAIGVADRLYLTHVLARPDGDVLFPEVRPAEWREISRENFPAGPKDSEATAFAVYDRR